MAYAITQPCCTDAACVSACPVNCIHPTPDEPAFATADMLHVDPAACIDCGACADACPVDAILPVDMLAGSQAVDAERNREYFDGTPADGSWARPGIPRSLPASVAAPRIAVVGTGPAAGYTARALLRCTDSDITVLDRHRVPGGLIRYGVAPDHPATKRIAERFAVSYRHPRVRLHLGVDVGRTISHEDILSHHHAVVYATGADRARMLSIPGEDLAGSIAATDFLAWCNGLPRLPPDAIDLRAGRAVIVGNGNVALDAARMLLTGHNALASSGIAADALAALRASTVSEVVLLGRRGPAHAAWAPSEFLGLQQIPGLRIALDGSDPGLAGGLAATGQRSAAALLRGLPIEAVDWTAPPAAGKRLVLRFHSAPLAACGNDRIHTLRVTESGTGARDIATGLLIRAVGSRGVPIPGLPFDPDTGIIPNIAGRVSAGIYVAGWAKRGATGGIGTNRGCAAETVGALLDDATAGLLPNPPGTAKAFTRLVRRRASRPPTPRRADR